MATLSQLENQIQKLQRRAEALREKKSAEVIGNIRALMHEYGLSIDDLDKHGLAGGKRRGRPVGSKNGLTSGAKKLSKAANGHAGKTKMPPKYRDPVTGLTWSGHARPPAWIKDVPDRDVFLIGKRGRPASTASAAKKTAKRASRPAAGKVARKRAAQSVAV